MKYEPTFSVNSEFFSLFLHPLSALSFLAARINLPHINSFTPSLGINCRLILRNALAVDVLSKQVVNSYYLVYITTIFVLHYPVCGNHSSMECFACASKSSERFGPAS